MKLKSVAPAGRKADSLELHVGGGLSYFVELSAPAVGIIYREAVMEQVDSEKGKEDSGTAPCLPRGRPLCRHLEDLQTRGTPARQPSVSPLQLHWLVVVTSATGNSMLPVPPPTSTLMCTDINDPRGQP